MYSRNRRNGEGIYFYSDGAKYIGSFRDDNRHGRGVYTTSDGHEYNGDFQDGRFEGFGYILYPKGTVKTGWYENWELCEASIPPNHVDIVINIPSKDASAVAIQGYQRFQKIIEEEADHYIRAKAEEKRQEELKLTVSEMRRENIYGRLLRYHEEGDLWLHASDDHIMAAMTKGFEAILQRKKGTRA